MHAMMAIAPSKEDLFVDDEDAANPNIPRIRSVSFLEENDQIYPLSEPEEGENGKFSSFSNHSIREKPPPVLKPKKKKRKSLEQPLNSILEKDFSLLDFFNFEMQSGFFSQAENSIALSHARKRERMMNFVSVPIYLERLMILGTCLCLDAFLFLFTYMPLRALYSFFRLISSFVKRLLFIKKRKASSGRYNSRQVVDLLRGLLCFCCIWLFSYADYSRIYHLVRGQAIIKLYVIINVLEIFEKLCCSFGLDILDSLFWIATQGQESSFNSRFSFLHHSFQLFSYYFVAQIYVCIHTAVHFLQIVTLNVAINSHNNLLFTILVSVQFVELKSSVFKKFAEENLFQLACSDMVERFQTSIFILLIAIQNWSEHGWETDSEFLQQLGYALGMIAVSEVGIDWVKHAFITKFNRIKPVTYARMATILSRDVINARREHTFLDHTHTISKRIGFVSLPMACLCVRVLLFSLHSIPVALAPATAHAVLGGLGFLLFVAFTLFKTVLSIGMEGLG
eukprot:GCRY01006757.1.p1 GENE.GCRY01006757.1~~GCRY01006757.1.p1  ORF type:complete len:509 (+),score=109.94 GCRY01006757.1:130-1656(+)